MSNRIHRIESLMQAELARLIQQELQDPRLSMVTITEVKVSRDLSYAKIYVTLHDKETIKQTLQVLKKASNFLRRRLAECIKLRKMPTLNFYYDESVDRGQHISKLLNDIADSDE